MSSDEKYTKQFFNMARSKHAIAKAIVDNIQYLAKKEQISNAELEKDANISAGYISRLSRVGNTTIPNVEVLLSFSKKLGVTLDYLVTPRLKESSENETILLKFIDKVIDNTVAGNLEWIAESPEELKRKNSVDSNTGETEHPLFKLVQTPPPWPTDYPEYEGVYLSYFGDQCVSTFKGDCYHVELPMFTQRPTLYLMNIETYSLTTTDNDTVYDQEIDCFELCLFADGVEPLCRTDLASNEIEDAVKKLYYSIKRELESNKMSKNAIRILKSYINDDDAIPF